MAWHGNTTARGPPKHTHTPVTDQPTNPPPNTQVRHPNILEETFLDLDLIFGFVDSCFPEKYSMPCSQVRPSALCFG